MSHSESRRKSKACLLLLFALSICTIVLANSSGPPLAHTGDFGEPSCNTSGCHTGNPLNASSGSLTISGVPAEYQTGQTYSITVTLDKANQRRWGFSLSARFVDSGMQAGTLVATNGLFTQIASMGGLSYISHTFSGSYAGDPGPKSWTFDWTAPATATGAVRFSCAGNAANNNGSNSGDFIYTATAASNPAAPQTPSLTITMSRSIYTTGDTITATEFRIKNPSASPTPVKLQVWLSVPGVGKIFLVDLGADGGFALPPGIDSNVGTVSLITITSDFPPRGSWELSSRIENPSTGALLSEDLNPFTVQ